MNGKFNNQGNKYVLFDKETRFPLYNYHFNNEYYTQIANDLSGESRYFEPDAKTFTSGERFFLVKDGEDVWSVGGLGEGGAEVESRQTEYNLYSTVITARRKEIEARVEGFVPTSGTREIFTYTIKNLSAKAKKISVVVACVIEGGYMSSECRAETDKMLVTSTTVPYHVYYEDYEKVAKWRNTTYCATSLKPDKVICNAYVLFGGKRKYLKNAFDAEERLASYMGGHAAAFVYNFEVLPQECVCFSTVMGACVDRNEAKTLTADFVNGKGQAYAELTKVKTFFENYTKIKKTFSDDENVNNFASFWQVKQILCMAMTKRFTQEFSIRNSLQDAMGLGYVDKEKAREYFIKCIRIQKQDGSIIQHGVWDDRFPPRGLGLLYMKDGPSWLVVCVSNYVLDNGDYDFLNTVVPYRDGGEDTIWNHLLKAVAFMWKDRGMFGLSLLGDGDWTDPINGPGRKGKGVSTWTSMAFVYGMRLLVRISERIGADCSDLNDKIAEMDKNIVENCFKEDRFIAGIDDDGEPYGCKEDKEGNLFLNMHSWAIISGVAKGEILTRCIEVIEELTTPVGVLVMKPPFTKWNPKFGKISVKQAGKDENGSAYCHASAFAAYAMFKVGQREKGENIIKNILPTHECTAEFELQAPIFIPNYWFTNTPQYGQSSANNSTGTTAWFLKIYHDFYDW